MSLNKEIKALLSIKEGRQILLGLRNYHDAQTKPGAHQPVPAKYHAQVVSRIDKILEDYPK